MSFGYIFEYTCTARLHGVLYDAKKLNYSTIMVNPPVEYLSLGSNKVTCEGVGKKRR